ncbi:hypothetical protein CTA1_11853 [Colletotrichum tanaceti]|uniref:Rhodopsin domain-containing protein n=1 Tax=Colletotrichum tanaceti TaxID=1306861 RepID=A0A4U6X1F2_9PEZI|nr:hypothetical protein CTA1_11853 [Colletotrichum tanaceti]
MIVVTAVTAVTRTTTAWATKRAYLTEDTNNTNVGFFNFATYELLYVVVSLMTFLDLLTLSLRLASLRDRRSRPLADDYSAMLASLLATATGCIVVYGAIKRVTGRHDWDPWPPPEGPWPKSDYSWDTKDTDHPVFLWLVQIHLKANYALNCLQGAGIGAVRLAFLFLFRRLFMHQGRLYVIMIDVLIAFVTLFMLLYTLVSVFLCGIHPEAQWTNHDATKQYCFLSMEYTFAVAVVKVALNLSVFLFPMYPLSKITSTMTRDKRAYLLIVFAFGFLAVISSIFSLIIITPWYIFQITFTLGYVITGLAMVMRMEPCVLPRTGWSGTTTLWAYMEVSIGAAVCNLPVISRFLIRRWWGTSRQAVAHTVTQVVTRNRRVIRRVDDLESLTLESGTRHAAAGTTGVENAPTDKAGQEGPDAEGDSSSRN